MVDRVTPIPLFAVGALLSLFTGRNAAYSRTHAGSRRAGGSRHLREPAVRIARLNLLEKHSPARSPGGALSVAAGWDRKVTGPWS